MEAATSLKNGNGLYINDLYNLHATNTPSVRIPFTAWPIGYPVLIYLMSKAIHLDVFWAGKAVNLLFIGLSFLLLRQINRQSSYIIASIYGAFTILEVSSYTWSESIFMFGLLCFIYAAENIYSAPNKLKNFLLLLCATLFMFLIRYIGIVAVGAIGLAVLFFWRSKEYKTSLRLLYVLLVACLLIGIYLFRNYLLIGHPTGIPRLTKEMEGPGEIAMMVLKGLGGELFLIRRYYFNGLPDWLTLTAAGVHLLVLYLIYSNLRKHKEIWPEIKKNYFSHLSLIMAGLYLFLLIVLRSISQFDPTNYRLLSPFTFLVLIGAVHYVAALPDLYPNIRKAKHYLLLLFVFSLLLNLPKAFIVSKLLNL